MSAIRLGVRIALALLAAMLTVAIIVLAGGALLVLGTSFLMSPADPGWEMWAQLQHVARIVAVASIVALAAVLLVRLGRRRARENDGPAPHLPPVRHDLRHRRPTPDQ